MTRRDGAWRGGGVALTIVACAVGARGTLGPAPVLMCFLAAILGIVLMLNGKRVATVWRAGRRGHHQTAAVIHAQRARRRSGS